MLAQCQQCKKTYSTAIKALCQDNREYLCPYCKDMLGKLKHLGHDFMVLNPAKSYQKFSIWGWRLAIIFCSSLLLIQVYFFEHTRLAQKPTTRLWLQKICQHWNCPLPTYKNRDDFAVMYGNFQQIKNQHYIFQAVISNQGKFEQHYPHIKLNLLSFSGESFAQRIFTPTDYLVDVQTKLIAPSKTVEISMKIAIPEQKVEGYIFELI